jgi:hypothetical protein
MVGLAVILLMTGCAGSGDSSGSAAPSREQKLAALPQGPVIERNAAYVKPQRCTVSDLLVPTCGVLWGAAVNPRWDQGEDWDSAYADFAKVTGRPLDVSHRYYSGDQLFPDTDELRRARQPGGARIFFLNWKPAPERTFAEVAAGAVDARIDREAAYLKAHVKGRFFLTINHEPEDLIDETPGSGSSVADYRAMYRHVVTRLRAQGVERMVTVMVYRGNPAWSLEPWFDGLYPGDDVVDWIGFDPYVFRAHGWNQPFHEALNRQEGGRLDWPGFYNWAQRHYPDKPLMLSEWGISQGFEDKKVLFQLDDVRRTLRTHPAIKALIYWNTTERTIVGATEMDNPRRRRAFAELATSTEVTGSPITPR